MVDFLVTLSVLSAMAILAARRIAGFDGEERPLLWWSFIAHEVGGFANIAVTRYYYGWGDMLSYHRDGVIAAGYLRSDFWGLAPGLVGFIFHQPDPLPIPLPIATLSGNSAAMQGVSSFAMLAFGDSLYGTVAFIAGAAFLTKVALYVIAREELPDLPRRPLIWGCTLLPSALFWSTSLLKEPIAMIGLLLAIHGWYQWSQRRKRVRSMLLLLIGSGLVLSIKAYGFPAFVLAATAWHLARRVHSKRGDVTFTVGHFAVAGAIAAALVVGVGMLAPEVGVDTVGEQLSSLQAVGQDQTEGSSYGLGPAPNSVSGQIALAPLALLTALFRPFLFESSSVFVLVNSLEMTVFTVATILVLARRGISEIASELVKRPFLSFCAVFTLVFGTFVGLGSTNMGTLSRYRMPLTPFFATLLLALLARKKSPQTSTTTQPLVPEPT